MCPIHLFIHLFIYESSVALDFTKMALREKASFVSKNPNKWHGQKMSRLSDPRPQACLIDTMNELGISDFVLISLPGRELS